MIEQAADIVKNGGIVIFPTRTLYGMGVDAFNENAVSRVFCFKQRAVDKPLSVLVSTIDAVVELAADIPDAACRLMRNFWPGRLTIVFAARPDVPPVLTAGTGKIGIRVPDHPVAGPPCRIPELPVDCYFRQYFRSCRGQPCERAAEKAPWAGGPDPGCRKIKRRHRLHRGGRHCSSPGHSPGRGGVSNGIV